MKHKQCEHNREIRVKSDFGDSECHAHPPGPTSRNGVFAYPIIRSEEEACGEFKQKGQ